MHAHHRFTLLGQSKTVSVNFTRVLASVRLEASLQDFHLLSRPSNLAQRAGHPKTLSLGLVESCARSGLSSFVVCFDDTIHAVTFRG